MSAPTCQSCGQVILWRQTVDGRRIPLDTEPAADGVVRMLQGGRCRIFSKADAAEARENGVPLYMPHHASCRHRARHQVPRSQLAFDL